MKNQTTAMKPRKTTVRSVRSVLTASIAALLGSAAASHAAVIIWGDATTIVGNTDVLTVGTLGYAYNMSNTAAASATVNTVAFTASNSATALGTNVTIAGLGANNGTAFGSAAGNPYALLPAAYKNLLRGGDFGGVAPATLTLNNLIAGHSYATQIWVNDNRSLGGADRKEAVTGGGGNTVTLDYNSINADGGVGQYAIGLFNASATTQAFSLIGNASTQFNSIQVRDVTNLGYWVGTGGATWDASTTANFASNLFSAALTTTDFATAKAPLKSVTFADTYWNSGAQIAVTQTAITVAAGGVSTGRVAFENTALNYTVTSPDANGITGAGSVSKGGTGSLTLLGGHSYTGGTYVGGGTLFVGNGTTDGLITGNVVIGAGANVTVNNAASGAFPGAISGAGSLTKLNTNTLILAGDTSHTGTTTIGAGTLEFAGTGGPLGAVVNNGTLVLNRASATSIAGPISGTGSIVHAGAGVTALAGASNFAGATNITGGTLRPAVAAGSTLWLDAAKTSSFSTSGNSVSQWSDAAGGVNFASQGNAQAQPTLAVDNAFAGPSKSMVDFGADGNSGQWMQFSNNLTDIRSVFWVMKGSGFLLGSTSTYDFHRDDPLASPTAPIWWGDPEFYSHANIRNGQTYLDGTLVNGTTTGLSGNYQTIDVITTGNVQANALANDRNIAGRVGGQQIGEVIIFNTALNTADRQRVETYLSYKWFGTGTGVGDILPVTTPVTISGGGTLDLSGVNYQTVASLSSADPASRITLGSAAFTVGDGSDTTFGGVISEGGSVTKTGTGKLTLTNTNTYTGATTISNGTLELGGTNGTPGTGALTNNATLRLNWSSANSLANPIGGTGVLVQAGPGTATLTGANTYTGATLVSGGALQLNGAAAGTLATSGVTINAGATLGFTSGAASTLNLAGKPLSLGGTIAFDLGAAGVNDAITTGSFTLTGNSAFTFNATGALATGSTYTLLTSANPIATGGFTISGQAVGRLTLAPVINSNTITLTPILVQGGWNNPAGGNWSVGNPAATGGNWTNYKPTVTGDAALFGAAITGAATVNVDTPHTVGFITFANANSYTIGSASGSNLTFDNSPGNAVIAVTTGAHTIAESAVLASSAVVGPSVGTALTISGNLSGAGGVQLSGAGTLTLGGANTHSGGVALTGGTLNLANASALGAGSGVFTLNGGTFDNTTGGAMTVANNNPQAWGGSFTFTGSNSVDLGTGPVTLTASSAVNVGASTLSVGGAIDGAFGFAKSGPGTLTLSGASTFTGGLTQNAGTLNIDNPSALGVGGTFTISGGTIDNTSGGAISSIGNPLAINGDFTFTGSNDLAVGSGAGSLGTAPGAGRVVNVNAGTLTLGSSLANGTTADTLIKAGSGTLILSGANSHSVTLVSAGILQAGSDSALGANGAAVIVSGGGSLDMNGRTLQGYTSDISIGGNGANPTLGALGNSGVTNLNAIRGIVLTANASIGGDGGRWDIGRLDFNANPDVTVNHIEAEGFTLTKVGSNYLGLLTGANNLAGFIINGGTVAPHENTSFGAGPVTVNAGAIVQPWAGLTLTNPFTVDGGTFQTDGFIDTYAGGMSLAAGGVTFNTGNGDIVVNSVISGAGTITKTGGSTLRLTAANTQTGNVFISGGNVRLGSAGGPAILGDITFTQGGFTVTEAPNQFGPDTTLTFNSGGSHAEVALYGSDQTVAGITSTNDLAVIQNSHGAIGPVGASSVLTINQDFDSSYSGYIRDNTNNDAFQLGITKDGTGALTISGPNLAYTGVTTILDGTLNIDGPIGAGGNVVDADGGETNFRVSQTLAELNIADGAVVTLGGAAPAPALEFAAVGGAAAVPEPGSASLLLLGALGLLGRRRRH